MPIGNTRKKSVRVQEPPQNHPAFAYAFHLQNTLARQTHSHTHIHTEKRFLYDDCIIFLHTHTLPYAGDRRRDASRICALRGHVKVMCDDAVCNAHSASRSEKTRSSSASVKTAASSWPPQDVVIVFDLSVQVQFFFRRKKTGKKLYIYCRAILKPSHPEADQYWNI